MTMVRASNESVVLLKKKIINIQNIQLNWINYCVNVQDSRLDAFRGFTIFCTRMTDFLLISGASFRSG